MRAAPIHRKRLSRIYPREVWLEILRWATWVPDLLDPEKEFVVNFYPTLLKKRRRLLRESLVTKRYLIRVCKQWHSLALPFLYESVFIGRGRSLRSLSNTLKLSRRKAESSGDAVPFGWWTRRLDFAMRDLGHDLATELGLISEIIESLPNLNIITFGISISIYIDTPLPMWLLQELAQPNLRAIIWYNSSLLPQDIDWMVYLENCPDLTTICLPISLRVSLPTLWPDVSVLRLPSLRTLALHMDYGLGIQDSSLPSIRRLFYHAHSDSSHQQILEKYGGSLEIVQLRFGSLSEDIKFVSRTCPNLSELHMSLWSWGAIANDPPILPLSIHTLGLQCTHLQAPKREYKALFAGLYGLQFGPKLKTIQFLEASNTTDLRLRHYQVLSDGVDMLSKRGVEVRDHEGKLMF